MEFFLRKRGKSLGGLVNFVVNLSDASSVVLADNGHDATPKDGPENEKVHF